MWFMDFVTAFRSESMWMLHVFRTSQFIFIWLWHYTQHTCIFYLTIISIHVSHSMAYFSGTSFIWMKIKQKYCTTENLDKSIVGKGDLLSRLLQYSTHKHTITSVTTPVAPSLILGNMLVFLVNYINKSLNHC